MNQFSFKKCIEQLNLYISQKFVFFLSFQKVLIIFLKSFFPNFKNALPVRYWDVET